MGAMPRNLPALLPRQLPERKARAGNALRDPQRGALDQLDELPGTIEMLMLAVLVHISDPIGLVHRHAALEPATPRIADGDAAQLGRWPQNELLGEARVGRSQRFYDDCCEGER